MNYTTNYNLKKPEGTDVVNINDLNDNFDAIDQALDNLESSKVDKTDKIGADKIVIDSDDNIDLDDVLKTIEESDFDGVEVVGQYGAQIATVGGGRARVITGTPLPDSFVVDLPSAAGVFSVLSTGIGRISSFNIITRQKLLFGYVSIAAEAGQVKSAHVNFGRTLDSTPRIVVTANSALPDEIIEVTYGSPTTTGFDIYIYRETSQNTGISWIAIVD